MHPAHAIAEKIFVRRFLTIFIGLTWLAAVSALWRYTAIKQGAGSQMLTGVAIPLIGRSMQVTKNVILAAVYPDDDDLQDIYGHGLVIFLLTVELLATAAWIHADLTAFPWPSDDCIPIHQACGITILSLHLLTIVMSIKGEHKWRVLRGCEIAEGVVHGVGLCMVRKYFGPDGTYPPGTSFRMSLLLNTAITPLSCVVLTHTMRRRVAEAAHRAGLRSVRVGLSEVPTSWLLTPRRDDGDESGIIKLEGSTNTPSGSRPRSHHTAKMSEMGAFVLEQAAAAVPPGAAEDRATKKKQQVKHRKKQKDS